MVSPDGDSAFELADDAGYLIASVSEVSGSGSFAIWDANGGGAILCAVVLTRDGAMLEDRMTPSEMWRWGMIGGGVVGGEAVMGTLPTVSHS